MTEPIVNHSIKGIRSIKGAPASADRMRVKYSDWGAKTIAPNPTEPRNKLFKAPTGYMSPLKQMGIDPQYQISLPCVEVNDLSNKRIVQGKGRSFNKQLLNPKPVTGLDKIAFDPEMRIGKIGADLQQRPFAFSSFQYC